MVSGKIVLVAFQVMNPVNISWSMMNPSEASEKV